MWPTLLVSGPVAIPSLLAAPVSLRALSVSVPSCQAVHRGCSASSPAPILMGIWPSSGHMRCRGRLAKGFLRKIFFCVEKVPWEAGLDSTLSLPATLVCEGVGPSQPSWRVLSPSYSSCAIWARYLIFLFWVVYLHAWVLNSNSGSSLG